MPAAKVSKERMRQVACIAGMAMVWPSIHNQLLYPLTFTYPKEGELPLLPFYLVYSLVLLATTLFVAFLDRDLAAKRIFSSKVAMAAFGLMGSAGIALLVACDLGSGGAQWLLGAGTSLSALFVPVHFIFWSLQLVYSSKKRAAFDLILSYLVFCAITTFRLAFGLHAWPFSICYPLVSSVLAVLVLRTPAKEKFALGKTPLSSLPLSLLIPSVVLVYIATVSRCLLNPVSATYSYPPQPRVAIYLCLGVLMTVLAVLFRPRSKIRTHAKLASFSVVAVFLVGAILLTALTTIGAGEPSNFPTIAGINAVEVFIWLLVLMNAQSKHTGIVRPAAAFLIAVVGASHLISVIAAEGRSLANVSGEQLPVLVPTIVLAFLVAVIANVAMTAMLFKAQQRPVGAMSAMPAERGKERRGDQAREKLEDPQRLTSRCTSAPEAVPACLNLAADEEAYLRMQEAFGLSKRETDTLRLAARNRSTREIAQSLYVAESTVNSHIKGIYRKCDVHSRQELRALVNRFKQQG